MLLCFPVPWGLPEQLWQEPDASLARGGSPGSSESRVLALCWRCAKHPLLPSPPVYLLPSCSWTRCCVIGTPVSSHSQVTSAIFVCVAAEFSGGVDAFFFFQVCRFGKVAGLVCQTRSLAAGRWGSLV